MAGIELVIKIPEEEYRLCRKYRGHLGDHRMISDAIANGVPLPKHHGRLIDASNILTVTEIRSDGSEHTYVPYYSEIEEAPAIIEADKAERSDKE